MKQILKVAYPVAIWIFTLILYTTNVLWEEELCGFLIGEQQRNFDPCVCTLRGSLLLLFQLPIRLMPGA